MSNSKSPLSYGVPAGAAIIAFEKTARRAVAAAAAGRGSSKQVVNFDRSNEAAAAAGGGGSSEEVVRFDLPLLQMVMLYIYECSRPRLHAVATKVCHA